MTVNMNCEPGRKWFGQHEIKYEIMVVSSEIEAIQALVCVVFV